MKRAIALLSLPLVGCIPIVAGAAAGRAAAREEVRTSGPLDDSGARMVGLTVGDDLRVASVEPGGPAEEAGVKVGDLVREVDGYEVTHVQQAMNALHGRAGKKVPIDLERDGRVMTLWLKRRCLPELGCAKSAIATREPRPTDPGWKP
jgi:serine protease Do